MPPAIREQIQADLPAAMKARDAQRVSALRATLAAVANAEAVDPDEVHSPTGLLVDVGRKRLSECDVHSIVAHERDDMRSGAEHLRSLGRPEAHDLAAKAAILDAYLSDGCSNGRSDGPDGYAPTR